LTSSQITGHVGGRAVAGDHAQGRGVAGVDDRLGDGVVEVTVWQPAAASAAVLAR
jgi:hypothetical protein